MGAPTMRRPPFPSRGRGMTEARGFPAGSGCSGGFSLAGTLGTPPFNVPSMGVGQRQAPLRREGSPAVLTPGGLWVWRDDNSIGSSACGLPQVASFGWGLCLHFKLPVFK